MDAGPILTDPHYQAIYEALGQRLDPLRFEEVAVLLLQKVYPTLAHIPGGNDGGRDGSMADRTCLVVTTASDPRKNLRGSLRRWLHSDPPSPRRAVLATSSVADGRLRSQLQQIAQELQVELCQVHDRGDLAKRLYRDPDLCFELLHLRGSPSALSPEPPSLHAVAELPLLGREEHLRWLSESQGDRLLVGQPGVGKSFLLREFARRTGGWFLHVDYLTDLPDALRSKQPKVVIVDDAHAYSDALEQLLRIRGALGRATDFEVVASTWPGCQDDVRAVLSGLPERQLRTLEGLPRAQIKTIYESLGLGRLPSEVLRSLIDQADNRPGLAVIIAKLWQKGDEPDRYNLLNGRRVSEHLLSRFKKLMGVDAEEILACFALGGDRGLLIKAVECFLEPATPSSRQRAVSLKAGGVLREAGGFLSVWPRPLRWGLVRRVFLSSPATRRDLRPLLDPLSGRHRDEALSTLLSAVHGEGGIDREELQNLVRPSLSSQVWTSYAALGREEAEWALEVAVEGKFYSRLPEIAGAVLDHASDEVITHLFSQAAATADPHRLYANPLVQAVAAWIGDLNHRENALSRRSKVARVAANCALHRTGKPMAVAVLAQALSPVLTASESEPSLGRSVTLYRTLVPVEQIAPIREIWDAARDHFADLDTESWLQLEPVLQQWLDPDRAAMGAVSAEQVAEMQKFAREMLSDLAERNPQSPGLQSKLQSLARRIGLELPDRIDPVFTLLLGSDEVDEREALSDLARRWSAAGPEAVARHLLGFVREAEKIGRHRAFGPDRLLSKIAAETRTPELWLRALEEASLPAWYLAPFLRLGIASGRPGWAEDLTRLLHHERYRELASRVVLNLDPPPEEPIGIVLDQLPELLHLVESEVLKGGVSPRVVKRLLRHPSSVVSLAAAVGEWCSEPFAEVRADVRVEWRRAVLRAQDGSSPNGLADVFGREPDLAFEWLLARVAAGQLAPVSSSRSALLQALQGLTVEQRLLVLHRLPAGPAPRGFLLQLVGNEVPVFTELLQRKDLRHSHLDPLRRPADDKWAGLAAAAYEAGRSPEEIAQQALEDERPSPPPKAGSGLDHWLDHQSRFQALSQDPRASVQAVAEAGLVHVAPRIAEAEQRQKAFELSGEWSDLRRPGPNGADPPD